MKYSRWFLVAIFALAFVLRFWQLGNVPASISNDEAAYIYSAYSIWKTGSDIAGHHLPLSINLDNSFSPVPVYVIAPFVGLFDLNAFWGRFPFALMGFLSVVLLYFIVKQLLNERIALFSAFAFAVSPWHLQLSRSTLDGISGLFFFLLGFYVFLKKYKNGSILWSLPLFMLAFFSYHGTKFFLVFFIPFLLFVYREQLLKRKSELLAFLIGCVLVLGLFNYIAKTQHVTRQHVLLWKNMDSISEEVDIEREKNTAPQIVRKIYSNKPLYLARRVRENYFEIFSPQFLFLYGETSGVAAQYGTLYRGVMYMLELPLLIVGMYYVYTKQKKIALLIFGLFFIAPIPSAVTQDKSYVIRSIMMLPVLMIFVGCGIAVIIDYLNTQHHMKRKAGIAALCAAYAFFVSIYLYQYYFRYPIYASEAWFYSTKQIAEYLGQNSQKYKHVTLVYETPMFLPEYGFYNKTDPKKIQYAWADFRNRTVDNVHYDQDCLDDYAGQADPEKFLPPSSLYIVPYKCYPHAKPAQTFTDRGEPLQVRWRIFIKK